MNENKLQRGAKTAVIRGVTLARGPRRANGAKITPANTSVTVVRESEENTALFFSSFSFFFFAQG